MRLTNLLFPAALLVAGAVPAQTVPFRGEVRLDDTISEYRVVATGWPIKFRAGVPDNWMGLPLYMNVENVGTADAPQLIAGLVKPCVQVLDVGQPRIGQVFEMSVLAGPGNFVQIWTDFPGHATWSPLKGVGAWVLGSSEFLCGAGVADDRTGTIAFEFLVPDVPELVGMRFLNQASVYDPNKMLYLLFSNPETREVLSGTS